MLQIFQNVKINKINTLLSVAAACVCNTQAVNFLKSFSNHSFAYIMCMLSTLCTVVFPNEVYLQPNALQGFKL